MSIYFWKATWLIVTKFGENIKEGLNFYLMKIIVKGVLLGLKMEKLKIIDEQNKIFSFFNCSHLY